MSGKAISEEHPLFKKWEEDWANELFREYPEGLGRPDFQTDGTARIVWSIKGFIAFQKFSSAFGDFEKVNIDE
jgi:hypothetical protein